MKVNQYDGTTVPIKPISGPEAYICHQCGRADGLRFDAYATWDHAAQRFELAQALPDGDIKCDNCNGDITAVTKIDLARQPIDYEARVRAYEADGMTRSDAQAVVDAEMMQ